MIVMPKEPSEALYPLWGIFHPSYHPLSVQSPSPTSSTSHDLHSFPTFDRLAPRSTPAPMYTPSHLLLPITLPALSSFFCWFFFIFSQLTYHPPFMAPKRSSSLVASHGRDCGRDPSHWNNLGSMSITRDKSSH